MRARRARSSARSSPACATVASWATSVAGDVLPPLEYDPETSEPLEPEFVEVGPGGTVRSWTWVAHPTPKHPFDHPFAFALISSTAPTRRSPRRRRRIDGGDVDGMRVAAQYRDERDGAITDVYFVPEADAHAQDITAGDEPVTITEHLVSLRISEPLYPHRARSRAACSRAASSASARRRRRCTSRATATTTSSAPR